jgi:hypothetical protein
MIILTVNINNLNTSLQVGDTLYARELTQQSGANDQEGMDDTGELHIVGILVNIVQTAGGWDLHVNDDLTINKTTFIYDWENAGSSGRLFYLMFSKNTQGDSGVLGYYAEAKFTNNSKEKAELFAVSSEVIMNSN